MQQSIRVDGDWWTVEMTEEKGGFLVRTLFDGEYPMSGEDCGPRFCRSAEAAKREFDRRLAMADGS